MSYEKYRTACLPLDVSNVLCVEYIGMSGLKYMGGFISSTSFMKTLRFGQQHQSTTWEEEHRCPLTVNTDKNTPKMFQLGFEVFCNESLALYINMVII